jgi:hypothetical protein
MGVTAVVESDDPANGAARNEPPCCIATGKARREVVMGCDVAGGSEGKHHQLYVTASNAVYRIGLTTRGLGVLAPRPAELRGKRSWRT